MCETSHKGDIAVAKVISDLTIKGYDVLKPMSEHLRFDLAAHKDNIFYKIQVKYSGRTEGYHNLRGDSNRQNAGKLIITKYKSGDFDYYAVYLVDKDCVIYPHIKYLGCQIRTSLPQTESSKFYWYEDFLKLTDDAMKKSLKTFGIKSKTILRPRQRVLPDKDTLAKEVWEIPSLQLCKKYKVTDRTIKDWCDFYKIDKPARGYWMKKKSALKMLR